MGRHHLRSGALPLRSRGNEALALGTVQFGTDYGINNTRGRVPRDEVQALLDRAASAGLDVLDTAHAYGDSERVLGELGVGRFRVVTKRPAGQQSVRNTLAESLARLRVRRVYGYLFHDVREPLENPSRWDEMIRVRDEGLVERIGASLYSPDELIELWRRGWSVDLVQVPYSVFDRRFESLFADAKARGVEIHTRSAFLQGLLFRDPESLPSGLRGAAESLRLLRATATAELSLASLALAFCVLRPEIDRVVIGVDAPAHLDANLDALRHVDEARERLASISARIAIDDENIVNPGLWRLER